MIKKHYTGSARRALNIIWNAAGRYDFDPPFMAFYPNGQPDTYFNMVIGLTAKYFDIGKVEKFFESYSGAARAEEFDEFLWLGIENCVYENELPERPILAQLRRARAEEFFRVMQTLSRQQMMYSSMPVFTQQQARWASVLGQHEPVMSPKERRMAETLHFPGTGETEALLDRMSRFLMDFFHYDASRPSSRQEGPSLVRAIAGKLRHQQTRRDVLFLRTGTGMGDRDRSVSLEHFGISQRVRQPDEADAAYIHDCFGDSSISESQLRLLENELCRGADAGCRLYVTGGSRHGNGVGDAGFSGSAGKPDPPVGMPESSRVEAAVRTSFPKTAQELSDRRRVQEDRNRGYVQENARLVNAQIRHLSGRLNTIFESWLRFLPVKSSSGSLIARDAWRMKINGSTDVFEKNGDEAQKDIALTLLLDASMSRVNSQEIIAAEAYVIARSLQIAEIPVQVCAYRSLRGYTVIEVLKAFQDRSCDGILNFYAGGWNRDGLALRTMGAMIRESREKNGFRQLLFVLTDGSPNDSAPLAPLTREEALRQSILSDRNANGEQKQKEGKQKAGYGSRRLAGAGREDGTQEDRPADYGGAGGMRDGSLIAGSRRQPEDAAGKGLRSRILPTLPQEYQDAPAVRHTADAVRQLRKDGIRTGAIFHGATYHLENIHQIFGQEYVRIQKLDQLSDAVTDLLIREMEKVKA